MKRYILILTVILLAACQENERLIYNDSMHDIYYSIVTETRDSLYVSLLMAEDVSNANVQIKLLGHVLPAAQKFKVEVVEERSDAKEGVHYLPLPEYYEFPAGVFEYDMPVTLLKGDKSITEKPVTLTLRLVATSELGVAYENRSELRLLIADMLKKPEGEGYYGDMTVFKNLFGEYSKKKHLMIIELVGHDFWDGGYGSYGGAYGLYYEKGYYTPYARKLYKIITEQEIRDENGKIIQGWMVP